MGNSWENKAPEKGEELVLRSKSVPSNNYFPKILPDPDRHPLIHTWAAKPLNEWGIHAKVSAPRQMLAKLLLRKDVEEVNTFLCAQQPWGFGGATGPFSRNGDYDFTEIGLVQLLWYFADQPDLLYPITQRHIAQNLIVETGHKPRTVMPGTFRLWRDTENHILMKEFSRYLRNQWLFYKLERRPEWDNSQNGMEDWLVEHLQTMQKTGFYEFNSNPYISYTFTALLTGEAFAASAEIRRLCREILDQANWQYAVGSLDFRKYSPFRRRAERASRTGLATDPHTSMMYTWDLLDKSQPISKEVLPGNDHQALMALVMPYRPTTRILEVARDKNDKEFCVAIGHGHQASPEIYAGGKNWLLTAGGVRRGIGSQIASRPITLMLSDGATDLSQLFYIAGEGPMKSWNHTGVAPRFAVARGQLHIPAGMQGTTQGDWQLFRPLKDQPEFALLTYQGENFAIMAVFPEDSRPDSEILERVIESNREEKYLSYLFRMPGQTVMYSYDLNAPKSKYVMESVWIREYYAARMLERKHDEWPRVFRPFPDVMELYYGAENEN